MTVTINGTTGVSAVQDGIVTQADLAPGLAGNGPCFSAVRSGDQAIPGSTDTVILFDDKTTSPNQYDLTGAYAPGTGRFQPLVAGYYQINVSAQFNGTSIVVVSLSFLKNGATYVIAETLTGGSNRASVSTLVYLNGSTDYITITAYISAASGHAIAGGARFSGFLARAA